MVTFLFTDIEGSSAMWDRAREEMAAAVARHDAILDSAVTAHAGHVVKKLGDGLLAAFADPADAIAGAVEAQRSIAGVEWGDSVGALLVRMGIHTGPGEPTDNDYLGPSLNRAARIEAAGHGGQILVSAATRELVGDRLDSVHFLDLGEHHLRGLSRAERIYQVSEERVHSDFPPLRTESTPSNLPVAVKSMVGRAREFSELSADLDDTRLLTVTGAGGAGKTTLAIEVARHRIKTHPGGVWLFELAPLADGRRIAFEMLGTMRRPTPADRDAGDALLEYLASERVLLLIDNCEHLLRDVAVLVSGILRSAPGVTVLATSREPLGIGGERVWTIPTMTLPASPTPEGVEGSDAGALFVTRARAAMRSFVLTDETAPIVSDICDRLDGLPLAIELAAARLRSMSVGEIDRRLGDRFKFLRGGDRDDVPHHQTLRATVAWSYDLLDSDKQALYRLLSVFVGGFELSAAESVASDDIDVLDGLDQLVAQSLVIADGGDPTRYQMLETIRQFGAQQLVDSDEGDQASRAHLEWVGALVKEGARGLEGRDQLHWQRRFRTEIDNIRVALTWARVNDPIAGGATVAALSRFYWMYAAEGDSTTMTESTSFLQEGHDWATAMLEAGGDSLPDKLRARLQLGTGGLLCVRLGLFEEALTRLDEAAAIFTKLDDRRNLGWATFYRGVAGFGLVPIEASTETFRQALNLHTEADDRLGMGLSTLLYGFILETDEPGAGRPYIEQFAAAAKAVGAPSMIAHADDALAFLDGWEGCVTEETRLRAVQALIAFRRLNNYACICHALGGAATVLARAGDFDTAARILGIADATRQRLSMVVAPYEERETYVRRLAGDAVDTPAWDKAVAEGRTFEPDEGIDWVIRQLGSDPADTRR